MGLGFTDTFKVKKEGPFFEWILFEVDTFFVDTDHWGKFFLVLNVIQMSLTQMSSLCLLFVR